MVRSLLRIPQEKLNDLEGCHLTAYERDYLEELVKVLTPFEEATVYMQREMNVSASYIVPCLRGLRNKTKKIAPRMNNKLVQALLASLDRRLMSYETDPIFTAAAALDPKFRLRWCRNDEKQAVRNTLSEQARHVSIPSSSADAAPSSPPAKRMRQNEPTDSLLDYLEEEDPEIETSSSTISEEIEKYLDDMVSPGADALHYWEVNQAKFPHLAVLAKRHLCIPASSAPVERLFSVAGKIFRPDRCSLQDKTFQELIFIKGNAKFV